MVGASIFSAPKGTGMVAVQSRLDDVLLATRGKKVDATKKVRRTIPAKCSPTGKSQTISLDVSDEGLKELEKLDRQFEKALLEAGAVYGKLVKARQKARAKTPPQQESDATDGIEDVEAEITEENTAPNPDSDDSPAESQPSY